MRLTKIIVYGLFGEYDYEIPLNKGITYIHSPNGMGKSTVMRLVSDILSGNTECIGSVPFDRLDMEFDNNTRLFVENSRGDVRIQMSRNELEEHVSPSELRESFGCTYLPPERIYITNEKGELTSALHVYMKELSKLLREAKSDSTLKKIDSDRKMTEADIDKLTRDCLAKVDFIKQVGISPAFPSGCRMPPTRYEISENTETYRSLALGLEDWCDRYYRLAESAVVFRDVVNTIFVNKSVDFNELGFPEARMDRSGVMIPLEKFSSGEKQILIMFYSLLFRSAPGSLVIIDEPEVSLHVSWQQNLGRIFSDVARIRDLTVIVATHAPAVIHDSWDCAVELCNTRV